MNDQGLIVGIAYGLFSDPFADPHAWAYFNGAMHDLNDYLPVGSEFRVLINALGVNERGDIVGSGYTKDGALAGFVLSGIPEPSSGMLGVVGGIAFGLDQRRKSRKRESRP